MTAHQVQEWRSGPLAGPAGQLSPRQAGVAWQARGACRDAEPDLFFPLSATSASAGQIEAAKALCARCPVRRECLDFALATRQPYGIWGGTTEQERARLRRGGDRAAYRMAASGIDRVRHG